MSAAGGGTGGEPRAVGYRPAEGMQAFALLWSGQLVSSIGSSLSTFGLGIWAFERTRSATLFGLILFFGMFPSIVVLPIAGAVVDRWDRRWIMILSDSAAALSKGAILLLLTTGRLEIWHVYALTALSSVLDAFQGLASTATVSLLVPTRHLGRANGMMHTASAVRHIVSPALAGILLVSVGMPGILVVDLLTASAGVLTLLAIRIPRTAVRERVRTESPWRGVAEGWWYIAARPGLVAMVLVLVVLTLGVGTSQALYRPVVLSFTSVQMLSMITSVGGAGMLIGSLFMTIWGGPRTRMQGVLGFGVALGFFHLLLGLLPSVPLLALGMFGTLFCVPVVAGCSSAIWQARVPPEAQGRVLGAQMILVSSAYPLAYLTMGPVVDNVVGPLLLPGGLLAGSVGQVVGVGPGRGAGLIVALMGICMMAASAAGWVYRPLRRLEEITESAGRIVPDPQGAPEPFDGEVLRPAFPVSG